MPDQPKYTTQLGILLEAHRNGDESARGKILEHACERLRLKASSMLRHEFSDVKRWAETADVLQEAMLRLHSALEEKKPENVGQFYGLAFRRIRWELLDLARRFQGSHGIGHNHETDQPDAPGRVEHKESQVDEPETVEAWERFHQAVEKLPDDEREVTDWIWYGGLTQEETAREIGVSLKTVKRRWHSAKERLKELWKKG
jgi:RNA polymerase sigma-70 factor (ECF subfamily)